MPVEIPWEILGPAGILAVIILIVVFKFLLKMQAQKTSIPTSPSNLNTMSKKSLCFKQEGRISSNETAIKMIGDQLKVSNENNRKDHKSMFEKMEKMGTDIIKEIHKSNDE